MDQKEIDREVEFLRNEYTVYKSLFHLFDQHNILTERLYQIEQQLSVEITKLNRSKVLDGEQYNLSQLLIRKGERMKELNLSQKKQIKKIKTRHKNMESLKRIIETNYTQIHKCYKSCGHYHNKVSVLKEMHEKRVNSNKRLKYSEINKFERNELKLQKAKDSVVRHKNKLLTAKKKLFDLLYDSSTKLIDKFKELYLELFGYNQNRNTLSLTDILKAPLAEVHSPSKLSRQSEFYLFNNNEQGIIEEEPTLLN